MFLCTYPPSPRPRPRRLPSPGPPACPGSGTAPGEGARTDPRAREGRGRPHRVRSGRGEGPRASAVPRSAPVPGDSPTAGGVPSGEHRTENNGTRLLLGHAAAPVSRRAARRAPHRHARPGCLLRGRGQQLPSVQRGRRPGGDAPVAMGSAAPINNRGKELS